MTLIDAFLFLALGIVLLGPLVLVACVVYAAVRNYLPTYRTFDPASGLDWFTVISLVLLPVLAEVGVLLWVFVQ